MREGRIVIAGLAVALLGATYSMVRAFRGCRERACAFAVLPRGILVRETSNDQRGDAREVSP